MRSIADMKKYVATLVETNRALASDLDASRRIVASMGRERDALRRELSRVQDQGEVSVSAQTVQQWREHVEQLQQTLTEERSQLEELRQAQAELLRDAETGNERLRRANDRVEALTVALHRVEQERDSARLDLDEATAAMSEIRSYLQDSLADAWDGDQLDRGLYS